MFGCYLLMGWLNDSHNEVIRGVFSICKQSGSISFFRELCLV